MEAHHRKWEEHERAFAATAYHELRNPLNGTVGYLRLMHDLLVPIHAPTASPAAAAPAAASATALALAEDQHDPGSRGGDTAAAEDQHAMLLEHVSDALVCCESALVNLRSITRLYKLEATSSQGTAGGVAGGVNSMSDEPTDLIKLLNAAAVIARPLVPSGVELCVVLPEIAEWNAAGLPGGKVLLDGNALSQVLANLLHNSTRFTTGGSIVLACRLVAPPSATSQCTADTMKAAGHANDGGAPADLKRDLEATAADDESSPAPEATATEPRVSIEFEVVDTGCGMSAEMQAQLKRGERYNSIGGIGLGMVLCRQLVRAFVQSHGGSELELISPAPPPRRIDSAKRPSGSALTDKIVVSTAPPGSPNGIPGPGTCARFVLRLCAATHAAAHAGRPLPPPQAAVGVERGAWAATPKLAALPCSDDISSNGSISAVNSMVGDEAQQIPVVAGGGVGEETAQPTPPPPLPPPSADHATTSLVPPTPKLAPPPIAAAAPLALPRGIRVLVADDIALNRRLLSRVLTHSFGADWVVTQAETGEQMLKLLGVDHQGPLSAHAAKDVESACVAAADPKAGNGARERPHGAFDLLITDENFALDATVLKGSDCVRLLRAAGLTLPVVICSGNASGVDDADQAFLSAGADTCWGKPIPSWSDGSMQRQLAALLHREP